MLHSALSLGNALISGARSEKVGGCGGGSPLPRFCSLPRLGLIVLDEEHERTYKQEEGSIRYQTREVALTLRSSGRPGCAGQCHSSSGELSQGPPG